MEQGGTKESCTCPECQSGCNRRPGWVYPSQLQEIAKHLNMSTKDLFTKHLAVDWWEDYGDGDDRRAYVIAPAIVGHEGWYYPTHPEGRCSFYLNERCLIHPVKPIECARAWCGEPFTQDKADKTSRHKKGIARAWQKSKPKSMIEELLGHKPNAAAYTRTNSFEALFSHLFESIDIG